MASGAFRAVATAVAIFLLAAVVIATKLYSDASAALTNEVVAGLETESRLIVASAGRDEAGDLTREIEQRQRFASGRLYLLVDARGGRLAGNLAGIPSELAGKPRGGVFRYAAPGGDSPARQAVALATNLADGRTLFVARDVDDQRRALASMRLTAFLGFAALALLGLGGGYAVSRYALARVEAVNATARSIMDGDLWQRIAIAGSGDEIDGLAINLNKMLDRIEQLMAGMREVSDNIAHDLKTPLNRLRNRAEQALREDAGPQELRGGLERVIEEADELIKVFNALLLIARLEAGALEGTIEQIDLGALVADVGELYEPVAEQAGLALEVKLEPVTIAANRQLVGQAVANLIDNAIKYSSGVAGGARVTVSLVRRADVLEIAVGDNGPGIDAKDRERVLARFVRLERSRSQPGTGLGLSLVAAVARLHGGNLRLEDNQPGLRVVLVLPARPEKDRPALTSPHPNIRAPALT